MMTATWTGLEDAKRAIRGLNELATAEVLTAALRQVAQPMAEEMAAKVARRTGKTAEEIQVRVSGEETERNSAMVWIGARGTKGGRSFIARFLERGRAHQPARPFMRPVWDAHRERYAHDVAQALVPAYQRVVRRLARFAAKRGGK